MNKYYSKDVLKSKNLCFQKRFLTIDNLIFKIDNSKKENNNDKKKYSINSDYQKK